MRPVPEVQFVEEFGIGFRTGAELVGAVRGQEAVGSIEQVAVHVDRVVHLAAERFLPQFRHRHRLLVGICVRYLVGVHRPERDLVADDNLGCRDHRQGLVPDHGNPVVVGAEEEPAVCELNSDKIAFEVADQNILKSFEPVGGHDLIPFLQLVQPDDPDTELGHDGNPGEPRHTALVTRYALPGPPVCRDLVIEIRGPEFRGQFERHVVQVAVRRQVRVIRIVCLVFRHEVRFQTHFGFREVKRFPPVIAIQHNVHEGFER